VVVVVEEQEQEQVGGEGRTVRDMEQEQFDRLLQLFPVVRPRTYCVIFFFLFLFLSVSSFIVSFPVRHRCICTCCRSIGSPLRTPGPPFLLRSQSAFVYHLRSLIAWFFKFHMCVCVFCFAILFLGFKAMFVLVLYFP
jgi:hypothetical protein